MQEASKYSFDLMSIFFGDYPLILFLEIAIRITVILLYTILAVRFIGRRATGELSSVDVVLVVALGSSVGDGMFYSSIPLVVSLFVITIVVLLEKGYFYMTNNNKFVRRNIQANTVKLVEYGKLLHENIESDGLDEDEVRMMLRGKGVRYLEEVEHAYFEKSGEMSVFKYDNFQKETSILPKNQE